MMNRFSWEASRTVSEAAAAVSITVAEAMKTGSGGAGQAILKAGGIDVLDLMKEGLLQPATLIGLHTVRGLDVVRDEPDGTLSIGSMVTLAALSDHPTVSSRYPALARTAATSASPQIRNVATLGGNLLQRPRCWYLRSGAFHCLRKGGAHCFALTGENQYHAIFGNIPCAIVHPSTVATVLVALGASVELADAHGNLRRVALEEFFVTPQQDVTRENALRSGEVLIAVRLPAVRNGTRVVHLKESEKAAFDWPLGDVAVALDLEDSGRCRSAAIVLGAAAPVPYRARAAEQGLAGRMVDEAIAREAGRAAISGATPLAKNAYKLQLFETLVRRAVLAAADTRHP